MLGCCNVVSKVFLIEFRGLLLRCYGWSPGCCYAVAKVFGVVFSTLFCCCKGLMGGCHASVLQCSF